MERNTWIYIGAGLLLAALLILVIVLLRKRARWREMQRKVSDKLREEALDKRLIGHTPTNAGAAGVSPVPFDVRYDSGQRKNRQRDREAPASVMVQITEQSELATKKYMFHISDKVTFGTQSPPCDIVVNGFSGNRCEIFRIDSSLYIKNYGETGCVQLKRKRFQTTVGQTAIQLENHDVLLIGVCSYEITFAVK